MPRKKYIVDLTADERATLDRLITAGNASARTVTRAHKLLAAADGHTDEPIATVLHLGHRTVERIRQRFVAGGVDRGLTDLPRAGGPPKRDGKQDALRIALACSDAPTGRTTWTMQLLADRLVTLQVVDAISDETVRRILEKTI